jgi:predicted nucleic acid-binding protein
MRLVLDTSALQHGHPVYDMIFVALAQRYGCKLLTADKKLHALLSRIDPALCV